MPDQGLLQGTTWVAQHGSLWGHELLDANVERGDGLVPMGEVPSRPAIVCTGWMSCNVLLPLTRP